MKLSKNGALLWIKNMFLVFLGTVILAFGTSIFIIPMNIVAGGVSGLAIIIKAFLPVEFITVDLIVFVVTWLLFFVGLLILGKAFAIKTLLSSIIYPPAVSLFLLLAEPTVLDGFFCLTKYTQTDLAYILAAAVGGVLIGLGCAVTFLGGGSTGGVDIIAFSICKFFPRLKSSVVIFVIDALTIILGMFALKNLLISLLGILSAFVSAIMIEKVFLGAKTAFAAHIVTSNWEQINADIIKKMDRTTTIMDAKGGYTAENRKILIATFTTREYAQLLSIIGKNDSHAFVIIHRVHEIGGEGWNSIIS